MFLVIQCHSRTFLTRVMVQQRLEIGMFWPTCPRALFAQQNKTDPLRVCLGMKIY